MHHGASTTVTHPSSRPSAWIQFSAACALIVGLLLRLAFFHFFPQTEGDVAVYSNLAANLLRHGQLAITDASGLLHPSLIRLPGYPLFLALCFQIFGVGNALAVAIVQSLLDSITCLLLADLARQLTCELAQRRGQQRTGWSAALLALWIAELCPFTAIYVSATLTEGPTLFCIALACWATLRFQLCPSWRMALCFTAAVTWAAMLRPDGALLAVALAPALFSPVVRSQISSRQLLRMSRVCVTLALLPFAFWTLRNWSLFHVFQPLAPRYATDPGESDELGFEHWMGTWTLDFTNTVEVYWQVPDGVVLPYAIPARAWSTEADHQRILALFSDYNRHGYQTSPAFNVQLDQIAHDNLAMHPWRAALAVPALRVADMWLRPRVENLPIDLDWWVYSHHHDETVFSWCYAGVNLLLVLAGFAGLALRPRLAAWMLLYLILRSLLLATVQGPEARYTLQCLPMLIVTASVWLSTRSWNHLQPQKRLRLAA
jgi:hypothetical protein